MKARILVKSSWDILKNCLRVLKQNSAIDPTGKNLVMPIKFCTRKENFAI
jgi:hypothetical protein